jgi:hypothetical protein
MITKEFTRQALEKYRNLIERIETVNNLIWVKRKYKEEYKKDFNKIWVNSVMEAEAKKCGKIIGIIDEIIEKNPGAEKYIIDADSEFVIDEIVRSFKKNYIGEILINNQHDPDIHILLTIPWEPKNINKIQNGFNAIYRILNERKLNKNKNNTKKTSIEDRILKLFYRLSPQQRKDFCEKYCQ